jgi:hypothetical protein
MTLLEKPEGAIPMGVGVPALRFLERGWSYPQGGPCVSGLAPPIKGCFGVERGQVAQEGANVSPYADPQRRAEAKRDWSRQHFSKGAIGTHVVSASDGKWPDQLALIARDHPGKWTALTELATRGSAGVLAWRIKNGFYGPGWTARIRGRTVQVLYGEEADR